LPGLALHSALSRRQGYTSIEIKVNYLKAVRLGTGPLTPRYGREGGFAGGLYPRGRHRRVGQDSGVTANQSTLLVFDL